MTTIVWSTESVDTSAMLLAHALDDALFTKQYNDEVRDILEEQEHTNIILYGLVDIPWGDMEDDLGQDIADRVTVLHPRHAIQGLVRKYAALAQLAELGVPTIRYRRCNITFDEAKDVFGTDKVCLVRKTLPNVIGVATTQDEYDQMVAQGATHFTSPMEMTAKGRIYLGDPEAAFVCRDGVVCATVSEFKNRSFYEVLTAGAPDEFKVQIKNLFDKGLLKDNMGDEIDRTGWSDNTGLTGDQLFESHPALFDVGRRAAEALHTAYEVFDFAAIDVVAGEGGVFVANIISSPSLQDDFVLQQVQKMFSTLVTIGSAPTHETVKKMVDLLDEDNLVEVVKVLKNFQ